MHLMILIGVTHKAMFKSQINHLKSISVVFLGNLGAQLIQIFAFGKLITFATEEIQTEFYFVSSVSAFLVGFIGLKYDVAQIRPKRDEEGENLFYIATLIALLLSIFISFFSIKIGLLTFCSFLFNNVILLVTRKRRFNLLILGKLIQALSFLSFIYLVNKNIILTYSLSFLISAILTVSISGLNRTFRIDRIWILLKEFKDYPKMSVPSSIFMNLFLYSIGIFTPYFLEDSITAKLFQYEKFYLAPILLVANSFSQVYRAETQHMINTGKSITKLTSVLILSLLMITIPYYILMIKGILNGIFELLFNIKISDDKNLLYAFGLLAVTRAIGMPWMSLFYSKDKLKHDMIFSFCFGVWAVISVFFIGSTQGITSALLWLSSGILILYMLAFISVNPYDRNS